MTSRIAVTTGAILVGGLVGLAEASVVQTDTVAPGQTGLTGVVADFDAGSFALASREDDGRGRGRGLGGDDGADHDAGDDHGGRGRGADDGADHDAGDDHGGRGRGGDDGADHDAGDDHGGRGRGGDYGPGHDAGDDHGGHGDDGPGDDD
ncbi:hypothetical protein KBY28_13025 [Ruegeria pomeroyi]|nr:hypothetical protein [Ruegeria pomeroyi]